MEHTVEQTRRRGRPIGAAGTGGWTIFVEARVHRAMRQEDAGDVLGVSQTTISEWETLAVAPQKKYWERIANFVGISTPDVAREVAQNFL